MTTRISFAELTASGIRLRPAEAVTIVSDICRQYLEAKLPGIPSPSVLRLASDGGVLAEGPMPTDQDAVFRAAHLLERLVGDVAAAPEYRASGGLRLVIARGLGSLDLPPYPSLEEFRAALSRFSSLDVRETARSLFTATMSARVPREPLAGASLTISDVRRARRATGLTLRAIATVAGVPATRLRDLEWGDVRRWPADESGRAIVVRYARGAGLDEEVVLSVAWPLIQQLSQVRHVETAWISASSAPIAPGSNHAAREVPEVATEPGARGWIRWAPLVALLLAVALVARPSDSPSTPAEPADAMGLATPSQAAPAAAPGAAVVDRPRTHAASEARRRPAPRRGAAVVMAKPVKVRHARVRHSDAPVGPHNAPAEMTTGPADSPTDVAEPRVGATYQDIPEPPVRTPFLEKPLLRIVIR